MNDFLNIVPEFLTESLESITRVEKNLLNIVRKIEEGDISSLKREKKISRAVHSINGGSSFLGLEDIEKISSWLEKILLFLKNEKLQADEDTGSLVEDIYELIKEALSNKGKVKKRSLKKVEKQVLELFEKMNGKAKESPVSINIDGKEFSFSVNLDEIGKKLEKKKLFLLNIDPVADLDESTWGLTDFINELAESGDILDTIIDLENVYEESMPVSVLYLCDISNKKLRSRLKDIPKESIVEIDTETAGHIFGFEEDVQKRERETEKVSVKETQYRKKSQEDIEEQTDVLEKEDEREFVSFRIGKEYYAVSIKDVFDMKEMLPCSRIPNQPSHMLGVMNLRGNVVPVVDLRLLMGRKDVVYDEFSVFLIVKVRGKITGCVVDAIDDVVFLEAENTQITPATSRQINIDYVKFIAKDPKTGRFLIVLDLEKMLAND